jgi:hypothetical protein
MIDNYLRSGDHMKQPKQRPAGSPFAGGRRDRRILGRAQDEDVGDPYKLRRKLHEPTRCSSCGAVYHEGRWQWLELPPEGAHEELCQACHRINDNYPAGIVALKGPTVQEHEVEIVNLARNLERAEKQEHPLNRIMAIEKQGPDTLIITTTDIHLPRRIGTAVHHTFHGDLKMNFDEDAYFIRVNWTRVSQALECNLTGNCAPGEVTRPDAFPRNSVPAPKPSVISAHGPAQRRRSKRLKESEPFAAPVNVALQSPGYEKAHREAPRPPLPDQRSSGREARLVRRRRLSRQGD